MLRVRTLSGDPVAELHVEVLKATVKEGSLVVALKRFVAAKLGCSRFRMKLLQEDRKEIDDDAPLTGPADFTLVRMEFQSSDVATNAAFISACEGGQVTEVERLLNAPQNPDVRDPQYKCAGIHLAAQNGHLAIVRLLLEACADKEAARADGATALHTAAGRLDVVRLLLEAGADKDAVDDYGYTALHFAALSGQLDVERLLLEAGADKDAANHDGWTALHCAAQGGHLDVVRLLLEAGAEKDAVDHHGDTSLHFAALNGHLDVVRLLLEAGADKDAVTQDGMTALHMAAQCGHVDVVRLLQ